MSSEQKKHSTLQFIITTVGNAYSPVIIKVLKDIYPSAWQEILRQVIVFHKLDIDTEELLNKDEKALQNAPELALKDPSAVFNVIIRLYQDILKKNPHPDLDIAKLSYFHEVRHARNQWAHNNTVSSMDVVRHLDTASRLLHGLVHAQKEYEQIEQMKQDWIIYLGKFYSDVKKNRKEREEEKRKKEEEKEKKRLVEKEKELEKKRQEEELERKRLENEKAFQSGQKRFMEQIGQHFNADYTYFQNNPQMFQQLSRQIAQFRSIQHPLQQPPHPQTPFQYQSFPQSNNQVPRGVPQSHQHFEDDMDLG